MKSISKHEFFILCNEIRCLIKNRCSRGFNQNRVINVKKNKTKIAIMYKEQ